MTRGFLVCADDEMKTGGEESMDMRCSAKDRERLRELARRQAEIAASDRMKGTIKAWEKHGRLDGDARPMVTMDFSTFYGDILSAYAQCEGEYARAIEKKFLMWLLPHQLFHDDTIVTPYMRFYHRHTFIPFGIPVQEKVLKGSAGELGHHFTARLTDIHEDFHLLKPSVIELAPKETAQKEADVYNELCGDLLPARICVDGLRSTPLRDIVHIMSMEDMYLSMFDSPEDFSAALDMLANDYLAYFDRLGHEGYLQAMTREEIISQKSYAFTELLPSDKARYLSTDVWGFMDAQEATGISPEIFDELVFPAYLKVSRAFGRMTFGCCEAAHPFWERSLSRLTNLGKLSISPWCDEERIGEALRGTHIVYHRKPTPNLLCIGEALDEEAVRAHFRRTVAASRGCPLEIVQRDVYRIHGTAEKVRRYVEIIREECEKHEN